MSQAMSMQLTNASQAARGARPEKADGAKNGGKAGAFQNLLSTLLGGLKKAQAKGDEGKKGAKAELSRELPVRQASKDQKLPDAPKAAKGQAPSASAKAGEAAESAASEGKKPKKTEKKQLPDELAASSRNRESIAAALANNADLKASRKEGEKAQSADSAQKPSDIASTRRKEKGRIDLIDARKAAQKASPKEENAESAKAGDGAKTQENEKQLTIDLSGKGERPVFEPKAGKSEVAGEGSFSARLAESLRDGYNAEIVKHSAVILKNDDTGLIRLNLKPESLGNVKVRLNLADNNITGTIIVESEAAKDAFEANIEFLAKSFVDSGFQDAKLQVSVDSGAAGGQGGQARQEQSPGFRTAAKALDTAVPLAGSGGSSQGRTGGLSVFA